MEEDEDLDDEAEVPLQPRHKKGNKPVLNRAVVLKPEEGNATITEIFPNQSAVRHDGQTKSVLCGYRMSTLAFGLEKRERSPVCVGDRVRVENNVIVGRCERRNRIIRPAPNARDPLMHVLAANLDCLVIVAAAHEPDFTSGLVDRFLVAALAQKIPSILCVNKSDLMKPAEARSWAQYEPIGVAVLEVSSNNGQGVERLAALLRGKVAAFCGHSGVGKTSLLRRLLGTENYGGRVGAVNVKSGKGRHTTSGAVLLAAPGDASFIDTPGVMNFALYDVARGELLGYFPELASAAAQCAAGCGHQEPECALRAFDRYASYRSILDSLPVPTTDRE